MEDAVYVNFFVLWKGIILHIVFAPFSFDIVCSHLIKTSLSIFTNVAL